MRYRFQGFELDTDALELRADGALVETEPQVFSVLAYLLEHRARVVPKSELLDEIWGDRFVSESALTTRIKQARQVLGDTGQQQSFIKTLHGRGYRFVAEVDEPDGGSSAREVRTDRSVSSSIPEIHYAYSDGAAIAYQTFGQGPDLVLIAGFATNVEVQWEHPAIAGFLRRLGSFSRVTVLDKRGVGLSERLPTDNPPSLETRSDDLRAVMDAAGIDRATILGSSEGGALSSMFAASHPERVERLILHGTWVRHPQRPAGDVATEEAWGTGAVYQRLGPSLVGNEDDLRFLAKYERQSATPRTARLLRDLNDVIDVESILGAIRVPTLILHRRDDPRVPFACGEDLAARIDGAQLVELEGADHYLFAGDVQPLLAAVEAFVCAGRGAPPAAAPIDRFLATVLFLDTAPSNGDLDRRAGADELEQIAREVLEHHRGTLVKSTGTGLVATFDGPGRAVLAAGEARSELAPLGLTVQAGIHTAEIERRGQEIAGLGVDIAGRIAELAGPGEIWVSRTITDLVAGTGLSFTARGAHRLEGLEDRWALFTADL